jgi:hypothetical protein
MSIEGTHGVRPASRQGGKENRHGLGALNVPAFFWPI